MEITFNGKTYYFGRKPLAPQRETSLVYYENGFRVNRLDSLMSKEMSSANLRSFANMPICRRAINITKNSLLNCKWVIEKRDMNDTNDYSEEIKIIEKCLSIPNYADSFRSLWGTAIEDVLTGDCGAVEICVGSDMNKPIWLYPVDGFTIQLKADYIRSPKDIHYVQRRVDGNEVRLADEDLIYLKMNDYSHTPLGSSPIESAFCIINYLLNSQKYAGMITSNAVPKYILNLGEDINETDLVRFRKYFDEEVYGSGRTPIVGGSKNLKAEQIATGNDDGLYLKWQHFLITIIALAFNIDPKRLNEGSQTDRSTVEEQKENILDEAVKPLAFVISENINRKVIGRLGLSDKLVFRFVFEDTETRKKQKTDRVINEFNSDLITLDEARQMLGYDVSNGEYGNMLKSEYKTALNTKYALETQNNGGFNGVGKNRYE